MGGRKLEDVEVEEGWGEDWSDDMESLLCSTGFLTRLRYSERLIWGKGGHTVHVQSIYHIYMYA